MANLQFQLEDGILNGVYDKVYNCRVVKPTYEKDGLYSKKFMLDKRKGTEKIDELYKEGYTFTDVVHIGLNRYYLASKDSEVFIVHHTGKIITSGLEVNSDSPIRLLLGKGAGGEIVKTGTLDELGEALDDVSTQGLYDSGYIKLKMSGVEVGQYIVFNDGILKGATNRIEHIESDYVYILGTNSRGTIPEQGQNYTVYKERRDTILVGAVDGLYVFNVNGDDTVTGVKVLPVPVNDFTEYNGNILVLSERGVWYSQKTWDGNTNFYPTDVLITDIGVGLINVGTHIIIIGNKHKSQIIRDIQTTNGGLGYVLHSLEITSNIKSKYSYIYKDSVFMLLTDGGRLPTVNITNKTQSYSTATLEYSDSVFRGLFEELGEQVYGNENENFYYLISHKDGKSIVYELDFEYKHWIIHTYDFKIYKIYNGEILGENGVYKINGYTDLGNEYKQEINFSAGDTLHPVMPYKCIRTIIGLIGERVEIDLDIEAELGAKITYLHKTLTNYSFDTTLSNNPTIDNLVGFEYDKLYDGTIASLQNYIQRSARFIRFKYSGNKRFCLGESLLFLNIPKNELVNEQLTNE